MEADIDLWSKQFRHMLDEFFQQVPMKKGQVFVIGCSTSEVIGKKIGTAGALDIAEMIFNIVQKYAQQMGIHFAFQCCEHLNRALVVDRSLAAAKGWEEVAVVPVRHAGGAMAAWSYRHMEDPVVVEFIQADAGMDIGDTFIGMHLKHVAVPVRVSENQLGSAHVTLAATRPKLIGGVRARYEETNCE
ncbi:TIGR01440 family protein [Heyndrickxia acidiproducens]|uniref:TIGR01440 family protein n=1 Tax=Heyndrickxia acidiproducens TaxID=1121084 RepID=UPI00035DC48E|nr:TIGR01440 family protein [Heyndrickxia acidiproducens]